ncbi:BMA-VPS-18 [Dirofilaria immitis]|nr:BMA-VPS-18 [Dirofilaria immitis]
MANPITPSSTIFMKKIVDFRPKGQITHLCSSNGEMLLVIGARRLLHYPRQNTSCQVDVNLSLLMHDRIAYVHLSPNGCHAIISTTGNDNFYLNLRHDSAKQLKKLKGYVISSVGWNMEISTDSETSFIVLGTTKGSLFEISIISNGTVAYVRELISKLSGIEDLSVTGIEMCQYKDENQRSRCALFICLPGRLYCLSGQIIAKHDIAGIQPVVSTIWSSAFAEYNPSILQPLFAGKAPLCFHSMDDGQRNLPSAFVVYPKLNNELPTMFCWVGADGYTLGRIDLTVSEPYDMLVEDAHIQHQLIDGRYNYPLDVALTEYNVLLLYSNHIEAISLLSQKLVFHDIIGADFGQVKGMCRDAVSEMIWVYTDVTVWKYRPNEEFRDIWQIYLERGEYGKARAITNKLSNPAPHQLVVKKKLKNTLQKKTAAEILTESTDPFEVILLKFLSAKEDRRNGLKRFLEFKLKSLSNTKDKIQRDVLVLWLLEVQLTELAELRRNGKRRQLEGTDLTREQTTIEQQIKNMRQQIELFLTRSVVLAAVELNRDAVYHLITSHAEFDIQLYLAQKLKDYTMIVNVYLLQSDYRKVLEVIRRQHILEFYYKHSPLLIEEIPTELITAWIEEGETLVSDRLLPALYRCQDISKTKMVTAALKYLNFVINENWASRAMHNFMIALCAEFKSEELLNYFEKYGYDRNLVPYDVEYALRVCIEKQALKRCCVFMYCVNELYNEAVSLALTIDVELAKTCAKQMVKPNENEYDFLPYNTTKHKFSADMRRKVWLQIARHVIEKQEDIAACVSLLKESDNTIKIQDLLPFFPEFTTIEYFKGPLCECLKEHSGKIKQLQLEMKNAAEMAHRIRSKCQEELKQIRDEINDTVAGDCILCGSVMIDSIDKPFFEEDEYEREMATW